MGSGRESVCIRLTENGVEGGWRTAWALELLLTALAVLALAPDAMVGADGGAHAAVSFGLITRGTSILPRPFRPYCRVGLPSPALSCSPHSHLQQGRPPPLEQNRLCSHPHTRIPCRWPRHAPQRPLSFCKVLQHNTQQVSPVPLSLSLSLSLSHTHTHTHTQHTLSPQRPLSFCMLQYHTQQVSPVPLSLSLSLSLSHSHTLTLSHSLSLPESLKHNTKTALRLHHLSRSLLLTGATQKRRKRPTVKETMEEQYTRRRARIETHPHARTCTHIALNARPRKISAVCHKHAPGRSGTAPVSARIPRTGTRGRRESLQPAPAFPDIQHTRHLHPRLKQREAAMATRSRRLARVLPPIPVAWLGCCRQSRARENATDWGALDSR